MRMNTYDAVIIGGGVTGCMIARELSRYDAKIILLEKEEDVACGTSKANSAVVHAGFDAKPGTLKAKMNVWGNALFPDICEELDVPYINNGSLVVAVDDYELKILDKLLNQGKKNGVPGLEIIGHDRLMDMEPHLNPQARAVIRPAAKKKAPRATGSPEMKSLCGERPSIVITSLKLQCFT
ncbi:MAG: FAD-dependent oxidoreductase, partial [Firmicutes bacterium]|nr:FAD-dependent oxidoreductase [Bacillota bacterium]